LGVNGDTLDIVLPQPVPGGSNSLPAEELLTSPKSMEAIKEGLTQIEVDKWAYMAKLPSPVFRFRLSINSLMESLSNLKSFSHFKVQSRGEIWEVRPGEQYVLAENVAIAEVPNVLSNTSIDFHYDAIIAQMPIVHAAYSAEGKFISQATGEFKIKPTLTTLFLIFLGAWAFVVGLCLLLKQTLTASVEIKDAYKKLATPKP
jgi:hypothetical protein